MKQITTLVIALMLIATPVVTAMGMDEIEPSDYEGSSISIPAKLFMKMMSIIISLTFKAEYWKLKASNCECSSSGSSNNNFPVETAIEPEVNSNDANGDGVVNPLDIAEYESEMKSALANGDNNLDYDCNGDGVFNPLDIAPCKTQFKQALVS